MRVKYYVGYHDEYGEHGFKVYYSFLTAAARCAQLWRDGFEPCVQTQFEYSSDTETN